MAAIHGGRVTVVLTAKVSWWVNPYLRAAALFVRSIQPFVDLDDDQIDAFIKRQSAFVTKYGIRFYAGGKRV